MKYLVAIAGREVTVGVEGSAVTVNGRAVRAQLDGAAGQVLRRLVLDGHARELVVTAAERRGGWRVVVGGERFDVVAVDERTRAIALLTGRGKSAATDTIRSPMPGLVVRVPVAVGDTVAAGTGLIVVEAMKMENELRAHGPGVVTRIHAAPGDKVEKGAVLVELGPGLEPTR